MTKRIPASITVSMQVRDAVKGIAKEYGTSVSELVESILWKACQKRRRVLARKSRRETSTSKIGS
jgi:hypothetical protein